LTDASSAFVVALPAGRGSVFAALLHPFHLPYEEAAIIKVEGSMNGLKTALLLGIMSGLLLAGGEIFGGRNGLYIALAIAVFMNFFGYFFSDKMALSMYSARPVTPTENNDVYARVFPIVQSLTQRMSLPMPKLWLIADESPNAFATGRNPEHASVAFTAGILKVMNDQELEGVVAHELGHVKNRDILTSSVAATIAAAITVLARMAFWFGGSRDDDEDRGSGWAGLIMLILAPFAAMLIQMAISRTREYSADETSAHVTHNPNELISALGKLETYSQRIPMSDVNPATAHLFIIKPFGGGGFMKLFSTHPSTEDRIARLRAMR
jgi:heat shock protein HtpX